MRRLHDTTPPVVLQAKQLTNANHEARHRLKNVLLDGHVNNNEDAWGYFEVLRSSHAVLVLVDEGCNRFCLFRCWCSQEKLHVTRDAELIALPVELAKQLGIRDGSLHQFVDNLHVQPLTLELSGGEAVRLE